MSDELNKENKIYKLVLRGYEQALSWTFNHKWISGLVIASIIPLSLLIVTKIPMGRLPEIEKTELLLNIDWNEPISVEENKKRVKFL